MELLARSGIPYRHVDARDYHRLSRAVADSGCDTIVHLAAVAHITVTKLDRHLAYDNSITTLKNALDVAVGRLQALRLPVEQHGLWQLSKADH